jgi:hypothetical protein
VNILPLNEDTLSTNGRRREDLPHMQLWEYIKVAIQVGVLVWGAAMISAKVSQLAVTTTALTGIISNLQGTIEQLQIQNARIEVRLDNLEKKSP